MIRWIVAIHEAGHAAVSLALWQGHQLGVTIVPSHDALGGHTVDDQYALTGMPAAVAVREAIKRAMVALGGTMVERAHVGVPFALDDFLRDCSPDATAISAQIGIINQHARAGDVGWLVDATRSLISRRDVARLIDAIATALVHRGKVSGDMLVKIHEEHPTDPQLIRVPTTLAQKLKVAGTSNAEA